MELYLNIGAVANAKKDGRETYWKLNNHILKEDEFLGNSSDFWG